MKITGIELVQLFHPVKGLHSESASLFRKGHVYEQWFVDRANYQNGLLAKVHTDDGITGVAENPDWMVSGETIESMVKAVREFEKVILGKDPFQVAEIHSSMNRTLHFSNTSAKCLIDLAVHDIIGKALDVPISKILRGGPRRTTFRMCAHTALHEPKRMAQVANERVNEGYTALEVKLRYPISSDSLLEDVTTVRALAETVPSSVAIIFDCNEGFNNPKSFISMMSHHLDDIPNLSVEQPIHHMNITGLEMISKKLDVPIIADESAVSPEAVSELATRRAVDVISIKLKRIGGIYPALKILDIAESAGLSIRIDGGGGLIHSTSSAHVHALVENVFVDPAVDWHLNFAKDVVKEGGIQIIDGVAKLPNKPGLGVVLDEEKVQELSKHPVDLNSPR